MAKKKTITALASLAMACLMPTACDSIDCTLYNSVNMRCGFYRSGKSVKLDDTLTVMAAGLDSILVNRMAAASELILPLSYYKDVDSIVMKVSMNGHALYDTIFVEKTNYAHFESPDCPTTMFHVIKEVRSTHTFIDSITVTIPQVNYAQREHLQIHFYDAD